MVESKMHRDKAGTLFPLFPFAPSLLNEFKVGAKVKNK